MAEWNFVRFYPLHIFDALTFILNLSHSLFFIQLNIVSNIELRAVFFLRLNVIFNNLNHSIFLMHLPSYFITIIRHFVDSIKHCRQQQGNSRCFLIECNLFIIWLVPYFWFNHLHTSSLSFIVLSVQYDIFCNRNVRVVLFYSMQFLYDSTYYTFLMHSHSYFITDVYYFCCRFYHIPTANFSLKSHWSLLKQLLS